MSQDNIGVVIDAGSHTTKAGFAGEAFPRAVFPTTVARFRRPGLMDGLPLICCGKEAIINRGLYDLKWPVHEGQIKDWEEMEKLWHHMFYKELHVPPEEVRILHAIHPLASKNEKEKRSQILFECFTVKGLYLMKSPVLVLHASGRTSGIVWESGASCSYAAPVFEGFPLKHATILSPLTGELLTDQLQKLLADTGYSFTTPVERDLINIIKAERCYVAQEYEEEINSGKCSGENKISHVLPDGQRILLSDERFKCPEVLFQPALANLSCPNITELIKSSIAKCDLDYRGLFYENIVIGGGSSMFPGLVHRLKAELTLNLRGQPFKGNIDSMPSRHFASWIGGSILASMDNLKGFWMTKEEYEDGGSDRVKYKFF